MFALGQVGKMAEEARLINRRVIIGDGGRWVASRHGLPFLPSPEGHAAEDHQRDGPGFGCLGGCQSQTRKKTGPNQGLGPGRIIVRGIGAQNHGKRLARFDIGAFVVDTGVFIPSPHRDSGG